MSFHLPPTDSIENSNVNSNGVSIEDSIALDSSAAFQLLVCASSQDVREAAAEALWPRQYADQNELECSHERFADLPFDTRVLALICASVIARQPSSTHKLRAVPLYEFLAPPRSSVHSAERPVFRIQSGRAARTLTMPGGSPQTLARNAAFVLPGCADDTVIQRCSWGRVECEPYSDTYQWCLDDSSVYLNLSNRARTRARWGSQAPVIISASGEQLHELSSPLQRIFQGERISLGTSMLMRLAAGGLSGAVIAFDNQLPIVRGRRPRDATLSIEIGPDLESPLVGRCFKGDLSPRYGLNCIGLGGRVRVSLREGRTIAELDLIARKVGVWHGTRIRGSFQYHPQRARVVAEVA